MAESLDLPLGWQPFGMTLLAAAVASGALAFAGAPFVLIALPVAVAVSLPSLSVAARVVRSWRSLTVVTRALVVSCVLFSLHNIDFAFLRDKPDLAALGFTIATLIIFALSITTLAVVLERVSARQARIGAEMEAARRIQTKLLPASVQIPGFEVMSHMRPAESVGGDYFDIHTSPDGSWLFLGDVTGHGLGAGLVTLMAQSTVSSILASCVRRSNPRSLNYLANRTPGGESQAHGRAEARGSSWRCAARGRIRSLSAGSHDTVFVYRKATKTIEPIALSAFPVRAREAGLEIWRPIDSARTRWRFTRATCCSWDRTGSRRRPAAVIRPRGIFGEDALVAFLLEKAWSVRSPI